MASYSWQTMPHGFPPPLSGNAPYLKNPRMEIIGINRLPHFILPDPATFDLEGIRNRNGLYNLQWIEAL